MENSLLVFFYANVIATHNQQRKTNGIIAKHKMVNESSPNAQQPQTPPPTIPSVGLPPPPVLRRQTHVMCSQCHTVADQYNRPCWRCNSREQRLAFGINIDGGDGINVQRRLFT